MGMKRQEKRKAAREETDRGKPTRTEPLAEQANPHYAPKILGGAAAVAAIFGLITLLHKDAPTTRPPTDIDVPRAVEDAAHFRRQVDSAARQLEQITQSGQRTGTVSFSGAYDPNDPKEIAFRKNITPVFEHAEKSPVIVHKKPDEISADVKKGLGLLFLGLVLGAGAYGISRRKDLENQPEPAPSALS